MTIRTADGLALTGYYWPPARPGGDVMIYFHGNGHNQLVGAQRAQPLAIGRRGVLVASYRGYCGNPGAPSKQAYLPMAMRGWPAPPNSHQDRGASCSAIRWAGRWRSKWRRGTKLPAW